MMVKKKNRKRKRINFSIKKRMQVRLIFRIFIIIFIAVMLCGVIFLLSSQRKVASTYYQFHVQLRNFRVLILPFSILGMVAGILGALGLSLFFPHCLAGPLYRIEKRLEMITDGDLSDPNLIIRSGDELHDLARQVSDLMCKMRERVLSLKDINMQLDLIYNQAKDLSDAEGNEKRMPGLEKELKKMREILNEFKV